MLASSHEVTERRTVLARLGTTVLPSRSPESPRPAAERDDSPWLVPAPDVLTPDDGLKTLRMRPSGLRDSGSCGSVAAALASASAGVCQFACERAVSEDQRTGTPTDLASAAASPASPSLSARPWRVPCAPSPPPSKVCEPPSTRARAACGPRAPPWFRRGALTVASSCRWECSS